MKAAEERETRGRVSLGAACVRHGHIPAFCSQAWVTYTQTDRLQALRRIIHVSVSSDAGDSWDTNRQRLKHSEKTDKPPVLTRRTWCVKLTKTDML